jgi:O-antigen ligase
MGELPLISMKRLFIKGIFVVVFYFFFIELFKKKENLLRVWLFYGVGLIFPVLYTLSRHYEHDFSKVVSFVMPLPFFNDHTLYASCIAFILPVILLLAIRPGWFRIHRYWGIIFLGIAILFLAGEYFSFSRAAWLSIIAAGLAGLLILLFRPKPLHFLILVIAGVVLISWYSKDLYQNIETVDDVSRKENVEEHFRSVMNIQSDASNLERINRWKCALRMFQDKPITGFGPGTYQFVYAKYQISPEMTRISTNHGEKGNAHSEYLMYLSETGLPGLVIFLLLIFLVFAKGLKVFYSTSDKPLKWLTFAILMGFISFLVHSAFNSFLDTDKASILYYAAAAAIVSIALFHFNSIKSTLLPGDTNPGKQAGLPAK